VRFERDFINSNIDVLLTASHSLISSLSGSMTACLRFPLPKVAFACLWSSYLLVPLENAFLGLKVFCFSLKSV
jgi:hypothetical protein